MPRKITDTYNGNALIKKAGVDQKYTIEELKEYKKCRDNPEYFIESYCKIVSLDEGLVKFKMYDYQKRMVKAFNKNRFVINLLPRQTGKSTIVAAYILHYAIFNPDKTIAIVANKGALSREILSRLARMYENTPWFLQPGIKTFNKGNVEFGNGSEIVATTTSASSLRGLSISLLYLDEFAFVENSDEWWSGTYPVITAGKTTKVLITSTPLGLNLFYKLWMDATNRNNAFIPIEVKWDEHPDRDEEWKRITISNIGQARWDQEFACKFLGTGDTLISGQKLSELVHIEPVRMSQSGDTRIYEEPKKENAYVVVCDVAEGVGGDNSVANVFEISQVPYRQVAIYKSNLIDPVSFAEVIHTLAKMYNDSMTLVESNSIGSLTCYHLWYELEYDSMISTSMRRGERVVSGGFGSDVQFGIKTTKRTKNVGCRTLKTLLEGDTLIVNDFDSISEFGKFSRKLGSYEAIAGYHDDIAMTFVLFSWLTTQSYFTDLTDLNISQIITRKSVESQETDLLLGHGPGDEEEDGVSMEDYFSGQG